MRRDHCEGNERKKEDLLVRFSESEGKGETFRQEKVGRERRERKSLREEIVVRESIRKIC